MPSLENSKKIRRKSTGTGQQSTTMFGFDNSSVGIGVDIESIDRFQGLTVEKDASFLNKLFTEKELDYCFSSGNPAEHLAARYAGKEAIIKAFSQLDRPVSNYREIEIVNDKRGVPGARILKEGFDGLEILLSLSHSRETAIAFAIVAERTEG
jgi:holo-[acyl-carrier protein] synthase